MNERINTKYTARKTIFSFSKCSEKMVFHRTGIWHESHWDMILFYRRKMKDDLSQENTWKHDIFFKCSEKIAFPKKITPEHELSRTIRKDGISFSRKYDIFSRRKVKDDLSQKIRGNMMFSVYSVKMVPLFPTNMKLTFQKPIKKSKIVFSRKKNT